jgi:TonB-linked SusC/RagA family outer membrane protein
MNVKWLNDLKLRASYGKLGNQNIGIYPYQATLQNRDYVFNGAVQPGYSASTLVDPTLIWESSSVFDIGLDLTAFNNKLTVIADWYNKYTYDILRTAQIPLWVGLNPPTINNGAVRDKGFELAIQYRDQINKDLGYFIGGNVQRYRNSLEDYGSTDIFSRNIRKEGMELDAYYLYIWDGIFQNQEEIDKSPTQPVTPRPGDLKIRDLDGNGIINDQDRTRVDGKYPSFQYAMNMGLTFRQFDFSAQLYGSAGQKIYVNGWGIEPFRQGSLPTTDWRNRWTPDNPSQTLPRIYVADGYAPVQSYASTYFLKEASFMRLKNVQLGYTLPAALMKKLTMKSARLYFTADNVFTISNFPGLDPERVGDGNYVTYPQLRTFTFGAMVQF